MYKAGKSESVVFQGNFPWIALMQFTLQAGSSYLFKVKILNSGKMSFTPTSFFSAWQDVFLYVKSVFESTVDQLIDRF